MKPSHFLWFLIPLFVADPATLKQIEENANVKKEVEEAKDGPKPSSGSSASPVEQASAATLVPKEANLLPQIGSEPEIEGGEFLKLKTAELADESEPSKGTTSDKIEMPPHLNFEDFDLSTSEKLTLVEFYSPYCSHCKDFAPEWEKAYREFHLELEKLNIQMRQVNCIESGDLCEREQVLSYPNLRVYAPVKSKSSGENVKGESKHVDSFPRTLLRTADNVKKYLKNAVAEYDSGIIDLPSASQQFNTDEILKIIAGDIKEGHFLTFFPATNLEYKETDVTGKNHFASSCPDCGDAKQVWGKLSNQILSTMKTGHVNCYDNPNVCNGLGFKDIGSPSSRFVTPRYVVFLPKAVGLVRIDYKGVPTLDKMKAFANRLYENFQYEKLSASGLLDVMDYRKELPSKPLELYYPLQNKISIMFFYDARYVTDEDKAILPYLLEYVTNSPFNMHLYTAKHAKIQDNIAEQEQNLLKFINYDKSVPKKEFDKAMFLASTLTSKPTIFVLRDNALYTSVYQSFAPEDMRDFTKIKKFLDKNTYPVYQELTPAILPSYFSKKKETKQDKIVVTFIDSNNAMYTNQALYNMSLAAHEYIYLKKEYYFGKILEERDAKATRVAKLKEQNADSVDVIEAMREKIPHFFEKDDVLFTFFDISKKDDFKRVRGWKFNPDKYSLGDTVVISKDNRYFWDKQINGEKLVNDPSKLKPVLLSLLNPTLVREKVSIRKNLVGSPYGSYLSFMDYIHDFGVLGYAALLAAIYFSIKWAKKYNSKKKKVTAHRDTGGILGVPKKD